jgi:ribosomal RNA-processing protein 36
VGVVMGKKSGKPLVVKSNKPFNPFEEVKKTKVLKRDPRFDPLCGEFDKDSFSKVYSFIKDMKRNEVLSDLLIHLILFTR